MKIQLKGLHLAVFICLSGGVITTFFITGMPEFSLAAPLACTAGPHSGQITVDETW